MMSDERTGFSEAEVSTRLYGCPPIQYQELLLHHIAAQASIDLTVFVLSDLSTRDYYDYGVDEAR